MLMQRDFMGDERQGSAGELFRVANPGFDNSGRVFQWRRDLCSIQKLASHGTLLSRHGVMIDLGGNGICLNVMILSMMN